MVMINVTFGLVILDINGSTGVGLKYVSYLFNRKGNMNCSNKIRLIKFVLLTGISLM